MDRPQLGRQCRRGKFGWRKLARTHWRSAAIWSSKFGHIRGVAGFGLGRSHRRRFAPQSGAQPQCARPAVAVRRARLRQGRLRRRHVTDINAAAGCSVASFYRRFRDKAAFFKALHHRFTERNLENAAHFLAMPPWHEQPTSVMLRNLIKNTAHIMKRNHGLFRALFQRSLAGAGANYWPSMRAGTQRQGELLAKFLIARGEGGHENPTEACVFTLHSVDGALVNRILNDGPYADEAFVLDSLSRTAAFVPGNSRFRRATFERSEPGKAQVNSADALAASTNAAVALVRPHHGEMRDPDQMPMLGAGLQYVIKGRSFLCAPNYWMRYRSGSREGQELNLAASHLGFAPFSAPQTGAGAP